MDADVTRYTLQPDKRSGRRKIVSRNFELVATLAAFSAIAVLAIVVISVLVKGLPAINLDFFTQNQVTYGQSGGGIANGLVGTGIMVGLATAVTLPFGILIAIYVSEYARRPLARTIGLALDVLNGVPSIVISIFCYALLVIGSGYAAWKGAFALSIVMLPLVARSSIEVLNLVPGSLREASAGLGVSRWRTTIFVVMPTALGGVLTAATLAVARAAGETAPLLFTTSIFLPNQIVTDPSHAMAAVPLLILFDSEAPEKSLNDQAWAAAFVLMTLVLVASLTARYLLSRSERKIKTR
ncbi:MAG TPA: phosphate ABC transporter permease PstA [Gaiellaceae bacterium]|jgi:phosphate transport system permease protein